MTKIKICGLSRPADIEAANTLKPDYIGFVFAKASKRFVSPEQAAALRRALLPGISAVGVFVNESLDIIVRLLDSGVIDLAQLHGAESFEDVGALKRKTVKPVIQAFRVASPADVARAEASPADWILLDNGAGGTGQTFDWSLVAGVQRDYFLAGGLSPENVKEAIAACRPFAVDASSGLETEGVKDALKMAAYVAAVRGAA